MQLILAVFLLARLIVQLLSLLDKLVDFDVYLLKIIQSILACLQLFTTDDDSRFGVHLRLFSLVPHLCFHFGRKRCIGRFCAYQDDIWCFPSHQEHKHLKHFRQRVQLTGIWVK